MHFRIPRACMHCDRPCILTLLVKLYLLHERFRFLWKPRRPSTHTIIMYTCTYHCKSLLRLHYDHIHWLHSCLWYKLAGSCLHLYILLLTSELDLSPHQRMLFLLVCLYLQGRIHRGGFWDCNPPKWSELQYKMQVYTTDVLSHGNALIYLAKRLVVVVAKF